MCVRIRLFVLNFLWQACGLAVIGRAAKRIQRPWCKTERQGPLQVKRAESFQGLEISFGKLLLFYFMRPPIA